MHALARAAVESSGSVFNELHGFFFMHDE